MIKLASNFIQELVKMPESGMGYQFVEIRTFEYQTKRGIAYNAELVVFDDDESATFTKNATYARLLSEARDSAGVIRSIRVVETSYDKTAMRVQEAAASYETKNRPAKEAPLESSHAGEVFKRFSAYENDHRVKDGRLLPGTYATTEDDAKNVKTGKQAVKRYALPNPAPASNVFTIRPNNGTVVQRGIAKPEHGQPGGGVEIIFTLGTGPSTVIGPAKIPDE